MSKLRSISTSFWSDPFIEELSPTYKLLFLYLITNDKTNMLGIYESSIRKISFETGINKTEIEKGLIYFEDKGKIKYMDNYVILINYMKHQNYNPNMMKSAIDVYNNLPNSLKIKDVTITKENPSKAFRTLSNHYGMVPKVEVEYEREVETKLESEKEVKIPFDLFWDLYDKKLSRDKCESKWNRLSLTDQKAIIEYIPQYKKAQPEKKFRKNPETFLNNKSWNDELIFNDDEKTKRSDHGTIKENEQDWGFD